VAIQSNGVNWVHQDPVTKSQRITDSTGTVISTIDVDPWGGETDKSSNQAFQPHRFTTYERDANGGDDAMMRRYTGSGIVSTSQILTTVVMISRIRSPSIVTVTPRTTQ
jgi:hypothetical protein